MYRWLVLFFLVSVGCADAMSDGDTPYTAHDEDSDFEVATVLDSKGDESQARFDEDSIVSDALFLDTDMMSVQDVQNFFENTPYGRSTYLARERVNGVSAAQLLVEAAQRHNVNPMILIARLQVEGSHISKSSRPSQSRVNRALGCGCHDGRACFSQFSGLGKQFECSAEVFGRGMRTSVDGTGAWRKGHSKRSLDPMRVTPENHATAAMYTYTPWVLPRRGGNWLVWNITQKFVNHFGRLPDPVDPIDVQESPWVGSPCTDDSECEFERDGAFGFCYDFQDATGQTKGFCSLPCEGYCPDMTGRAVTFCVEADVQNVGICASKSTGENQFCSSIPGTTAQSADRFIGGSSARASTSTACLP